MGKNIEVSLEVFGNKRLTKVFNPADLESKSVGDIVSYMVSQKWNGENARTLEIIKDQIGSSGGYTPEVGFGNGKTTPVRFDPVKIGDPIDKYVQPTDFPNDQVRVAVLGDHVVGY